MAKRIIVCCDGTWNTPDQKEGGVYRPTNVIKIARAIVPATPDGTVQMVFYDQGVGTGFGLDKLFGGAFGAGLDKNVIDGYRFIMHNFAPGDEIFLFGFSRGAYTARSIAGFIRNCGVLKKEFADEIELAFQYYRSKDFAPDSEEAKKYRKEHAVETKIKCIGVWDTVGALGIPIGFLRNRNKKKYQFHDVKLSSFVENAFHALAVDERRGNFKPTLWETKKDAQQRVEQLWFPGVHSNVGGGYVEAGLSDGALLWMIDRVTECGLVFDKNFLAEKIRPDFKARLYNSKKGFWKMTRSYMRPVKKQAADGEDIHDFTVSRWQEVAEYRPKNLAPLFGEKR